MRVPPRATWIAAAVAACSSASPGPGPAAPAGTEGTQTSGFSDPEIEATDDRRRVSRRPAPDTPAATPTPVPPPPVNGCTERAQIGDLVICGIAREAPSHGGEELILVTRYAFENRGSTAVTVELVALDIVDPAAARVPMSGLQWSLDRYAGGLTTTVSPGANVSAVIDGKAKLDTIRYHVVYHHEATFRVDTDERVVRAGELYFRYPHRL